MKRLLVFLALLLPALSLTAQADSTKESSPIVKGVRPGLLGIADMIQKYDQRGDKQILMTPKGRLTLFPAENGGLMVSEQKGERVRNFVYAPYKGGGYGVRELEIMRGGSILNAGSKVLKGEALQKYITRIDGAFKRTIGTKRAAKR